MERCQTSNDPFSPALKCFLPLLDLSADHAESFHSLCYEALQQVQYHSLRAQAYVDNEKVLERPTNKGHSSWLSCLVFSYPFTLSKITQIFR
jgi:hypothetical protein